MLELLLFPVNTLTLFPLNGCHSLGALGSTLHRFLFPSINNRSLWMKSGHT